MNFFKPKANQTKQQQPAYNSIDFDAVQESPVRSYRRKGIYGKWLQKTRMNKKKRKQFKKKLCFRYSKSDY